MRLLLIAFLGAAAGCGGSNQLQNLPLMWRGVDDTPKPTPIVAQAFAAAPLSFGLRDMRPDPTAIGLQEEDGYVVHTTDNVAQFCSNKIADILTRAGARMKEVPLAILETELLEYRVVEGGRFSGTVRLRAIVRHNGGDAWSQVYEGTSNKWGKSHNPDNYNEALSNALEDAVAKMVQDEGFAHAIAPGQLPTLQPPPPPGG